MLENELITLWREQRLPRAGLRTEAGEPLEIVYPGRRNDGRGGDFRDAAIMLGGRLLTGDVEVHVYSRGWQEHHHHRDPCYNPVILHVVMWPDARRTPYLANGWDIPTLALSNYLVASPCDLPWPCSGTSPATAAVVLDESGEARFRAKAAHFATELQLTDAGECLYRGLMGAFGYARNQLPCIELAHRVPLRILEIITRTVADEATGLLQLEAMMLGAAGLLPSQRSRAQTVAPAEYVIRLEEEWRHNDHCGTMPEPAWEFFRLRPANLPTRRLAAMAHLLLRYRREGLLSGMMNLLRDAPEAQGQAYLRHGLVIPSAGYWLHHYDFGAATEVRLPTLLGADRADDSILNVLLPFAVTMGSEMADKALKLYRSYPHVSENSIEKQMRQQLGLSGKTVNSARRQQGLLQIYHTLCSQGKCEECPLSRSQDSADSSQNLPQTHSDH